MLRFVVLALALAQPAMAQDGGDIGAGKDLYRTYCATCHGLDGAGNGPMAGAMIIKPADLTALTRGSAEGFPLFRVIRRIDGRDPLVSHGSPMPVYGDFFEGRDVPLKTASGQPIMTSRPVVDLVAYIRTLQKE